MPSTSVQIWISFRRCRRRQARPSSRAAASECRRVLVTRRADEPAEHDDLDPSAISGATRSLARGRRFPGTCRAPPAVCSRVGDQRRSARRSGRNSRSRGRRNARRHDHGCRQRSPTGMETASARARRAPRPAPASRVASRPFELVGTPASRPRAPSRGRCRRPPPPPMRMPVEQGLQRRPRAFSRSHRPRPSWSDRELASRSPSTAPTRPPRARSWT